MTDYRAVLGALDAGTLAPQDFDHRAHIAVAFEALRADDFFTASKRLADGPKRFTVAACVPEQCPATTTHAHIPALPEA